ncbi:MAG: hypothetical protein M0D54_15970 [Hyphomonadaceae bacterium JAD_PAG50586_4]|nr:MAG: hypothetical protein M0D54_15970 [Hyphomonadaceae bacterium JAD_PAG50586_4]
MARTIGPRKRTLTSPSPSVLANVTRAGRDSARARHASIAGINSGNTDAQVGRSPSVMPRRAQPVYATPSNSTCAVYGSSPPLDVQAWFMIVIVTAPATTRMPRSRYSRAPGMPPSSPKPGRENCA